MKNILHMWQAAKEAALKNFKSATITFLLIMLVVNGFQMIFGPKNMVLGIIIAPMMLGLMARDMTAHPVKHFFSQALILCTMASAACFSMVVSVPVALLIHLTVVFFLLYTYTQDSGDHLYFQYILNYLFLIFIGPISLQQLPFRLLGMVTGAGCLLLYQCIKGCNRMNTVTRNALLSLLEDTKSRIDSLLCGGEFLWGNEKLDNDLQMFSRTMQHRQKATLSLSDASMATMETVLLLKKFNLALRSPDFVLTEEKLIPLRSMFMWLDCIHEFILGERKDIPKIQGEIFGKDFSKSEQFYQWTVDLRMAFLTMLCPEKRQSFSKTSVSLWGRLKIIIDFSPVRVVYALRTSGLLAVGILLVQNFHLEYGKWILFTIASVSLPYSDEVGAKAKKRLFATLIGGVAGLIIFSLIPSATGKMIAMLLSGYLSCYMSDYLRNFSCATFGALGGAVMGMAATGFAPVGSILLVRIIYVGIGIIIAIIFNCYVFPINQKRATCHLAQKYIQITQAVSESYRNCQPDSQLHYHLLLRMHQLEDKLKKNAKVLQWEEVHSFLLSHQMEIWKAQEARF